MKTRNISTKVETLHNLCYDSNISAYRPIGAPRHVADEGVTPLTDLADGRILASSPHGLAVIDATTGHTTPVDTLTGHAAAAAADNTTVVLTDNGHIILDNDTAGNPQPGSGGHPDWPPLSITAEPMTPVAMTVDPVALSAPYNPGDKVSAADAATLRRAVADSYRRLSADAYSQGVFFQPLIARAVITNRRGAVLYRGPELLVMPPDGLPFDRAMQLPMSQRNATDALTVSVPSFRLRVVSSPVAIQHWDSRAAYLYIEVSPCFHTWTAGADRSSSVVSVVRSGAAASFMAVGMPGAEYGLSAHNSDRNRTLVTAMLRRFDDVRRQIGAIERPLEHGENLLLDSYLTPDLETQHAALADALDDVCRVDAPVTAALNAPHSFTAASVASTPSAIAYGNVSALLFEGYSPLDYASAVTDSGPWRAVTRVFFADGSISSRLTAGASRRPAALGPLIVYPDPQAVAIEIDLFGGDTSSPGQRWRFWLTPDTSGCRAIALTDTLAPPDITGSVDFDAAKAVTSRASPRPMPGIVALAHPVRPTVITSVAELPRPVTAITPATSSSAAWDYGRTRFYAFTADSVVVLNAASSLASIATGRIASVGVTARRSVTRAPAGTVYMVSGNSFVYRLDGSRATLLSHLPAPVDAIGYDASAGLLVAANTDGRDPLFHIDPATGAVAHTSSSPGPFDTFLAAGTHLLMDTQSGLKDIAADWRDSPADGTPVQMVATLSGIRHTISGVLWPVQSERFRGTLSLHRAYLGAPKGAGSSAPTTTLAIDGPVKTPVPMPVVARPFYTATFHIAATVHAQTIFSPPLVSISNHTNTHRYDT